MTSFLAREARLVALTRALRHLALDQLLSDDQRRAAFAAAGLAPTTAEEAEALRRAIVFWTRVAPAAIGRDLAA